MASTGMFTPHRDLLALPGQGMPEQCRPQTSLCPFKSFHEFLGPAPLPMAEPRVLGPSFWVRPSMDDTCGTCRGKGGCIYGGGEISVSKSIRLGYKEDSWSIGFFF